MRLPLVVVVILMLLVFVHMFVCLQPLCATSMLLATHAARNRLGSPELSAACKPIHLPPHPTHCSPTPLPPHCLLPHCPPLCRCSLVYESLVGAIKDELQAARRRAAAATSQATAAEQRVQASMYYSRERFAAMEQEVKRTAQVRGRGPAHWLAALAAAEGTWAA